MNIRGIYDNKNLLFFNVGFTFDRNDKTELKDTWNCNQFCCKSDLCNGLWCEEYGIEFNKEEAINFIKKHVEDSGIGAYGYITKVDIKLSKSEWKDIYKYLVENYHYASVKEAKENGNIPYDYSDLIEDYSSYWEEPDLSYLKVDNNTIKINELHILKEEELSPETIKWINSELYGIKEEAEEMEI